MNRAFITLVETSQGYSIVENDMEVNKTQPRKLKEKSKKFLQQQFSIYPYVYEEEPKYVTLPGESQWFSLHSVHDIEKKALPEWFKVKKGILASMNHSRFEKNQDLYKKYRNGLIERGKNKYLSPTLARKGLVGDVCAILRIHSFLEKWGLINFLHPKITKHQNNQNIQHNHQNHSLLSAEQKKDCFDKDKVLLKNHYDKEDMEILKKVTRFMRPYCSICKGVVGVCWYEYSIQYKKKIFINKQNCSTQVKQENQPSTYVLRVCVCCFKDGNIPIFLEPHKFVQKSCEVAEVKKKNKDDYLVRILEKNKLDWKKSAEECKIQVHQLYCAIMNVDCKKLIKLLGVQEDQISVEDQKEQTKDEEIVVRREQSVVEKFKQQLQEMEREYRECYEQFVQAWLMKMNVQMEKGESWSNTIRSKTEFLKYSLVNKLASHFQKNYKI